MFADPAWIASAFTLANSVRAFFYVPQIVAVARSVDGARDIALSTWLMWTVTNLLGVGYAVAVAGDNLLALSFAASAFACALTIALTLFKRSQQRRSLVAEDRPATGRKHARRASGLQAPAGHARATAPTAVGCPRPSDGRRSGRLPVQ